MSSNPIFLFFASPASLAPTVIRLTLAILLFAESYQAMSGKEWDILIPFLSNEAAAATTDATVPAKHFIAAGIKMAVAFLLAVGFLTRLLSGVLIVLLILHGGAQGPISPQAFQTGILLGASLLALCLGGAGRWSLDRGISNVLLPAVN